MNAPSHMQCEPPGPLRPFQTSLPPCRAFRLSLSRKDRTTRRRSDVRKWLSSGKLPPECDFDSYARSLFSALLVNLM